MNVLAFPEVPEVYKWSDLKDVFGQSLSGVEYLNLMKKKLLTATGMALKVQAVFFQWTLDKWKSLRCLIWPHVITWAAGSMAIILWLQLFLIKWLWSVSSPKLRPLNVSVFPSPVLFDSIDTPLKSHNTTTAKCSQTDHMRVRHVTRPDMGWHSASFARHQNHGTAICASDTASVEVLCAETVEFRVQWGNVELTARMTAEGTNTRNWAGDLVMMPFDSTLMRGTQTPVHDPCSDVIQYKYKCRENIGCEVCWCLGAFRMRIAMAKNDNKYIILLRAVCWF